MFPHPRPIRPLSDPLINQIAAGEVVERPASIVKELIENSLDAGAGSIRLEVQGGGIDAIVVEDDGHGIPGNELLLALQRHCTSKIAQAADLAGIVSLGFRGEALASIGAVAEITLISRTRDAEHAFSLQYEPGRGLTEVMPASRVPGTSVTVRNLFARIPARRQFLRRPITESLAIQQLIRGMAFCFPGVTFALHAESRRQWYAPAAKDPRSSTLRWRAIFGAEFARDAQFIDVATDTMRVYGWLGPPALSRSQSDLQYLAVNGRLIRDRRLTHGLRVAFGDALPAGRYMSFALHLELHPNDVDVNVHPNKTEVRFRQSREVHDLLHSAARGALGTHSSLFDGEASLQSVSRVIEEPALTPVWNMAPTSSPVSPSAGTGAPVLVGDQYLPFLTDQGELAVIDLRGLMGELVDRVSLVELRSTLAFPVRIQTALTQSESDDVAACAAYGFEFAAIGPSAWVLRGVPAHLPALDADVLVSNLLEMIRLGDIPRRALILATLRALQIPVGPSSRNIWLQDWCRRIDTTASALFSRFQRSLDVATLDRLFASPGRF